MIVIPESVRAHLSRALLVLVVGGAGAGAIASQMVAEQEGRSLVAYQDGAQVWTICDGYTRGVKPGQTATHAECDRLRASEVGRTLDEVDRMVTAPMTPARHAAIGSFCYNVGLGACARSTLVRRLNAGDPGACDEIMRWIYVAGRDCRDPASNCRGIVTRREQESALCRL